LGFLECLLVAPPSPDPPALLDPAAWLSISPTAKKRLYLLAKEASPKSLAAGTKNQ
jgi:hypothetical protein